MSRREFLKLAPIWMVAALSFLVAGCGGEEGGDDGDDGGGGGGY